MPTTLAAAPFSAAFPAFAAFPASPARNRARNRCRAATERAEPPSPSRTPASPRFVVATPPWPPPLNPFDLTLTFLISRVSPRRPPRSRLALDACPSFGPGAGMTARPRVTTDDEEWLVETRRRGRTEWHHNARNLSMMVGSGAGNKSRASYRRDKILSRTSALISAVAPFFL